MSLGYGENLAVLSSIVTEREDEKVVGEAIRAGINSLPFFFFFYDPVVRIYRVGGTL